MSVQTLEAITDEKGNLQLGDLSKLPAHSKVYVIIPEQSVSFLEIASQSGCSTPPGVNFPMVRIDDEGLAKRLVKTVVEDFNA